MNGENELPEGWISVILEDYIYIAARIGWRGLKRSEYTSSGPLLLAVKDIQENGLIDYNGISDHLDDFRYDESPEIQLKENDVLITKDGTIGKIGYVHNLSQKSTTNSSILVVRPCNAIDTKYLFYYFRSPFFQRIVQEKITGSAVPHLFQKDIKKFEVFIPPLAEQRRIVAAVEALLARVNASRERLDRVPGLLKAFRQAVLAAACSGRLTEGWREEHPDVENASNPVKSDISNQKKKKRAGRLWGAGIIPKLTEIELNSIPLSWIWVTVHDLGEDLDNTVQVGPMSMQSKTFTDTGVPILNVGCIQWGYIDESKLNFMPNDLAEKFSRYKILENDILFTRSGTVGRCAIASNKQNGFLMTFHLLRVRTSLNKCLPKYLQFVFWGAPTIKRQTEGGVIGSTREGFNTNLLANLNVPLPPLPEQYEIVRRVESLFALADRIEQRVAAGRERADRLTQAILAKAFRGELVPTEAELARMEGRNYEPASVLLERIRKERESKGEMKPKKRKIRSEKGG